MFMIVPVMCGFIISVYTCTSWRVAEYAQIVSQGCVAAEEYRCYGEGALLCARERYCTDQQLVQQVERQGEVIERQLPILKRWTDMTVDTIFRSGHAAGVLYIEVVLCDLQGTVKYRMGYRWDGS